MTSVDTKADILPKYYAYLDSIEQINSIVHMRFDCIAANRVESISINKQSVLEYPSIVISISGEISQPLLLATFL